MKIVVREIAHGSAEYDQEVALRGKILREPLGLRLNATDLANEAGQIHLGAFGDGKLLGCLVLVKVNDVVMKMRQVAVEENRQNLGIGRRLVEASEAEARSHGFQVMELHARETAVPFYQRLGYEVCGEPFIEVTIPHCKMKKEL